MVRAHFIRVSDERHLWATTIDFTDVAGIERLVVNTISGGIVAGLTR